MKSHACTSDLERERERENLENFMRLLNYGYKNKSYMEESHPTTKNNVKEKN
jgi:hypothetical protein